MVTTNTIHKYIPFENNNINISQAVEYVREQLATYEKPKNKIKVDNDNTLLWHMSNNLLRTAIYKAALTHTNMFRTM